MNVKKKKKNSNNNSKAYHKLMRKSDVFSILNNFSRHVETIADILCIAHLLAAPLFSTTCTRIELHTIGHRAMLNCLLLLRGSSPENY